MMKPLTTPMSFNQTVDQHQIYIEVIGLEQRLRDLLSPIFVILDTFHHLQVHPRQSPASHQEHGQLVHSRVKVHFLLFYG